MGGASIRCPYLIKPTNTFDLIFIHVFTLKLAKMQNGFFCFKFVLVVGLFFFFYISSTFHSNYPLYFFCLCLFLEELFYHDIFVLN